MDHITGIDNKKTIGILLISTWKYNKFIDDTISGIRKYVFPDSNVKNFLHTDSKDKHDADIWFQKDISLLFELIKQNPNGCVFSPDASWYSQNFLGTNKSDESNYNLKKDSIKKQYGGTIQGGILCWN